MAKGERVNEEEQVWDITEASQLKLRVVMDEGV